MLLFGKRPNATKTHETLEMGAQHFLVGTAAVKSKSSICHQGFESRERSRFRLVPFDESMITREYLGWLNDKALMRFSRQKFLHHTEASCKEYLASFRGTKNKFWAIVDTGSTRLFGTITAYIDSGRGTADIGILVGHKEARAQGIGKAAWSLAMETLFRETRISAITGGTDSRNIPMIRIFAHCGMSRIAVLEGKVPNEPDARIVRYAISREEWEELIQTESSKQARSAPPWTGR